MWPLLMAAMGGLQSMKEEKQAEKDRKLSAITAQYSPWTHMQPQGVKEANYLGNVSQGLVGGLGMKQSADLNKAYLDYIKSKTPKDSGSGGGSGGGSMGSAGSGYSDYSGYA